MPVGLLGAGLFPDLRIAALHVLFIGGFSLMGFGVATHVSLSHLNLEALALGSPRGGRESSARPCCSPCWRASPPT